MTGRQGFTALGAGLAPTVGTSAADRPTIDKDSIS
jgi:hypothetical protein